MGVRQKIVVMSLGDVAGVALDVDDEFTGVEADVDMSPNSGVCVSCNGYVEDERDGGSRHYCRSVG
jgi:hypothetical protein